MSKHWDNLCTYKALKDGWYLASRDLRNDFLQIPFLKEQFAVFLEENLNELVRQLQSEIFIHRDVINVSIAKGNLSTRPGSFIPLQSRIVLFSAIKLVASELDKHLPQEVFSCRVRDKIDDRLFKESSLSKPPFITNKKISEEIDPFKPWSYNWLAFEEKSIEVGIHGDYPFLVTSDISAYFENIQLGIMRDQLLEYLPKEQQLINLFISAFEGWTTTTPQGRYYLRGIPQGTDISRFFGNLFLAPIDVELKKLANKMDLKYYRYMDDIRIFSKKEKEAKEAILNLERLVRQRHLNLQSAKTKIYNENSKEISYLLIDERMTKFNELSEEKRSNSIDQRPFIKNLEKLQKAEPKSFNQGAQKIHRARKSLTGLSDRLFRRMVMLYIHLGDKTIIPRLLLELERNDDQRYAQIMVSASKKFPRLTSIQTQLLKLMNENDHLQSSREATFLEACRYQSRIKSDIIKKCTEYAKGHKKSSEVRVQALLLIARTKIDEKIIDWVQKLFEKENNVQIKRAASLILIRTRGEDNKNFIKKIVFHPNDELKLFGKYLYACKTDVRVAKNILKQAFKSDYPWLLVDYVPLLFLQLQSENYKIRCEVKRAIHKNKANHEHINMDMRDLLKKLLNWAKNDSS